MIGVGYTLTFVLRLVDKIANFKWSRIRMPDVEVSKYTYWGFGVNFTRGLVGPGIGIGFAKRDIWIGWASPRRATCLAHGGCLPVKG